jgi:Txe/YoeB family toxin of Txe-Axe toxin-antitoxin module
MQSQKDYDSKLDEAVQKVNEAIRELNRLAWEEAYFLEKLKGERK